MPTQKRKYRILIIIIIIIKSLLFWKKALPILYIALSGYIIPCELIFFKSMTLSYHAYY